MKIQEHISLKELTTMKIGGIARYFCRVENENDLREALAFARSKDIPFAILGGGSNVLIHDKGFKGLVIRVDIRGVECSEVPPPSIPLTGAVHPSHPKTDAQGLAKLQVFASHPLKRGEGKESANSVIVIVGAGENWDSFVAEAVKRGLWGIENLSGIPGTVGATPVQNIGAYGAEIKDVLEWVEAFDAKHGEARRIANADCGFEYRSSIFKNPENKRLIITRVAFRLKKDGVPNLSYKDLKERFKIYDLRFKKERPALADIRKAVLEIRSKRFPDLKEFGTAGSFFKNPIISVEKYDELKKKFPDLPGFPIDADRRGYKDTQMNADKNGLLRIKDKGLKIKVSLAWILDNICGLKGYRKGNVALFEKQPIVLVNTGGATSNEIKEFAEEIIACVKSKTGIEIEWEVQKIQ